MNNTEGNQPINIDATVSAFMDRVGNFMFYLYDEAIRYAPWFVVIGLLIAGYLYITGNREGGKKALVASIVGLVIIVLSVVIVSFVHRCLTLPGNTCA